MVQVFPKNVAHVRRCLCNECFLAHVENAFAGHMKLVNINSFKIEFLDCPRQPLGHISLGPLLRICEDVYKSLVKS